MTTPEVQFVDLSKSFGRVVAVDDLNVEIYQGEFFAILGPSGCGKTTTLRMLAGLDMPTSGDIYVRGQPITDLPAHKRNLGMVFQDYGLFPHMTVFDNIAFGLKMRGWPRRAMEKRVHELLELVRLPAVAGRYPRQLSGGQQQRIALARALAPKPAVLLLDEPLSSLDAKLREELRLELRQLQRDLGITTIFVTHDQSEALALSDRVMVMQQGKVVQLGTPVEVYERPKSEWVVSFLGEANLFHGTIARSDGSRPVLVTATGMTLGLATPAPPSGSEVRVAMRPEALELFPLDRSFDPQRHTAYRGQIINFAYGGPRTRYVVQIQEFPDERVLVDVPGSGGRWEEYTDLLVAFPNDQWIVLTE